VPGIEDRTHSSSPRTLTILAANTIDEVGGAARAALRLCLGLRERGVDVELAVRQKLGDKFWVRRGTSVYQRFLTRLSGFIDQLPNAFYPSRVTEGWSNNWFPNGIGTAFELTNYDLLHLHWVGRGFFPVSSFANIEIPIVWTLHDMWGFTGGCHYSDGCTRFEESCGTCPKLRSRSRFDLSSRNLQAKRYAYEKKQVHVVSPSNWMAGLARKSSVFRSFEISVVPNGVDLEVYRPIEQRLARSVLRLPLDARIVLFGAADAVRDERKGFHLLAAAASELKQMRSTDKTLLVVFGSSEPLAPPELAVPVRFLGPLADDATLACLYSAADVMVAPSRQENLANTVMEAMACGTPVDAFDIGGNSDLIDHQVNGYLAKPFDASDLARGISWLLDDAAGMKSMSRAARHKCESKFDLGLVSSQYEAIYRNLVSREKNT